MKIKITYFIKYLFYFIFPIASVVVCRAFRLAQGEKNEEIIFGIFVGIVLDFIYSLLLWLNANNSKHKNINKAFFWGLLFIVVIILIGFVLSNVYSLPYALKI